MQDAAGTGTVASVYVRGPGSQWEKMSNHWGASWEITQAPGVPTDMLIVSSDGAEV